MQYDKFEYFPKSRSCGVIASYCEVTPYSNLSHILHETHSDDSEKVAKDILDISSKVI